MKCFDCHSDSKVEDALAICIQCGKGLCAEHIHLRMLHTYTETPSGMAVVRRECVYDRPQILCSECARAAECCESKSRGR